MTETGVKKSVLRDLIVTILALGLLALYLAWKHYENWEPNLVSDRPQSLVMKGGDPYIRALMRTISASESNVTQPYSVLYGGEQVSDLSRHPDKCIEIVYGPNRGNCTTAAGRYQFLTTTWQEKARVYHPKRWQLWFWESYSFEPQYQDAVVYAWLSDDRAWGADIPQLLREGDLDYVLWLLSGTWTSLGYGIESNSMTPYLEEIYQEMLAEELQAETSVPVAVYC